ncbi:hypothetical protein [Paenibacillus sp. FSL R5-0486]|uniref:hypothetical protein n=1 Tax=Paenibacillus sp. FSL R5-0486 TaxID=2921645 RepID=UPI0030D9E2CB
MKKLIIRKRLLFVGILLFAAGFTCFNIEELYAYKSLGIISITFGLILLILSGFIREKRSQD